MAETRRTLSSSTLTGDHVRNRQGDDLGKVEDLMIDVNDGHVEYAVLSFGGVMGMGDKLFAIPWSALTVDEHDHKLILDVDKDRLKNAPGFDKDHWPETANQAWDTEVRSYWRTT